MADTKVSALTEISVPELLDLDYGVDVSDTTDGAGGSSRKISKTRSFGILNHVCQGRLTLTSGVAVTTSDVTGATSVYFTPYGGQCVALYDGTRWRMYVFTELTLALGTLTSGKNYDVFLYDNAGTLTLESLAWTDDVTRATALALQNGVYCKTGALTRRYVGTFRTTATTTTEDSLAKRFLWNAQNQVRSACRSPFEGADSWSYTTDAWRQANANAANQFEYVTGDASSQVESLLIAACNVQNNSGRTAKSAVGVDSTSTPSGLIPQGYSTSGTVLIQFGLVAPYRGQPGLGYHKLCWLEKGADGSCTFIGDDGGNGQCGLYGSIFR